jgi:hypothetical protein
MSGIPDDHAVMLGLFIYDSVGDELICRSWQPHGFISVDSRSKASMISGLEAGVTNPWSAKKFLGSVYHVLCVRTGTFPFSVSCQSMGYLYVYTSVALHVIKIHGKPHQISGGCPDHFQSLSHKHFSSFLLLEHPCIFFTRIWFWELFSLLPFVVELLAC